MAIACVRTTRAVFGHIFTFSSHGHSCFRRFLLLLINVLTLSFSCCGCILVDVVGRWAPPLPLAPVVLLEKRRELKDPEEDKEADVGAAPASGHDATCCDHIDDDDGEEGKVNVAKNAGYTGSLERAGSVRPPAATGSKSGNEEGFKCVRSTELFKYLNSFFDVSC